MFKNTKRGSLAVETAIILPLVIIGILTVASLIKVSSVNENVMSIATDEARLLNIKAYTKIEDINIGNVAAIEFPGRLQKRIKEENKNCKGAEVKSFLYRYTYEDIDDLISFKIDYMVDCNLPIEFYGPIHENEKIVTRAFVGSSRYHKGRGFLPMEEQEVSDPVWIFPMSGKKYHKENCSYIKVAATKTILTSDIRKKYKPCSLCGAKEIKQGSYTYCFFRSGEVYHRGTCTAVDRYVVEIEKNEAIGRGYTPCLKCGG